ncbi:hypothetical protein V6N11_055853 [Hibiscus sabdariffa]|uniref:Uncharacterized protein n=1 Tax=Hibiscus sabdariffa TaxID=183260 RepID=A0ABR2T240_9ROSI
MIQGLCETIWYDFFLRILEQKRCPMLAQSPRSAWRVKLKKQVNTVHVRDQKHELTPPRNRDKPITQQDALPRSEFPPRFLPRQDPLSLIEASPLSSC